MDTTENKEGFYLANWYVEPDSDCISDNGQEYKLEAKVMALLLFLADRPGQVIYREEIEQAVWGETVVGYDALTTTMAKLRRALKDNSRQPKFIATVAKKGYRLIAPINTNDLDIIDDPVSKSKVILTTSETQKITNIRAPIVYFSVPILIFLIVGLVMGNSPTKLFVPETRVVNDRPSIAVLPFEQYGDENQSAFSAGVTEDISSAIAKLSGVLVLGRFPTIISKNDIQESSQIAKSLGVRYLLEGSIRRNDSRLRINVQLIDGETGFQLWTQRYDGKLDDLFNVQDDILHKIAEHLSIKITAEETRRIANQYTTNIEAYEVFLQGQFYFSHHTQEDNQRARILFQEAVALDPNFARAYGGMALTYIDEYRYLWQTKEIEVKSAKNRAEKLAKKALAVDPDLAQAHWVLGKVHLSNKNLKEAMTAAEKAISIEANYADAYAILAVGHIYSGNPQLGVKMMEKALRLNSENPARYLSALGQAYFFLQEFQDAEAVLSNAIKRNADLTAAKIFFIATLSELNKVEDAKWEADQLVLTNPELNLNSLKALFPISSETMIQKVTEPLKLVGLNIH